MTQRKAGILLSYLGQMVQILTTLIYTPVMLRLLGQSEYGLYQLVYSVVSYLSLLSLGFTSSYMRFYSREKAKNNKDGISRLNGMFMLIFMVMSCICVLCGIFMIITIHQIFGESFSDAEYETARVLMGLMIVNLALTFPNSVFNCIMASQERFYFQKLIILVQAILNPVLTFPLLILGYGSIGMVVITTILTFSVLVINGFYCFCVLHTTFSFRHLQFCLFKDMWIFTFFIFLNQIIDQINWSLDKFLLGRLAGTISVAIYSIGGQINTLYLQFSGSISNVFIPEVNEIVVENGDNSKLTDIFIKIGRIQFIVMMLILSGFIFFGQAFIQFWAGKGYQEAYFVTLFLIIPVTIPLIQNIGIEIQRAKNKHKVRSIVYFIISIVNVIVSIPLIKLYGTVGAAVGTALSLILGNGLFMNWYYHRIIGLDIISFWKSIFKFVPALFLPFMIGVINICCIEFTSIIKLGIGIFIYIFVYSLSMYYIGMNEYEKGTTTEIVKRVLGLIRG